MRTVQRELARRLDGVRFYALVPREHAAQAYASGIVPLAIGNDRASKLVGSEITYRAAVYAYLLRRFDVGRLLGSLARYRHVANYTQPRIVDCMIGGMDAVIDVHGFAFGDAWGPMAAHMAREWTRFCAARGKPFIFMPQSWGSFEKEGFAEPISAMLDESALFYARDTVSQAHLAKLPGKAVEDIPLAPDIAFRFEGAPREAGASLLNRMGVNPASNPLIGVAPNMQVYKRTSGKGTGNSYVQVLAHLCDQCVKRLGARVVLIPNGMCPPAEGRMDDRFLCGLVRSTVKAPASCVTLRDFHYAEEARSIIGNCDLLVGSRFHALVFALSQGVPVMALSWSHKYRELLAPFGLDDFVFEHGQLEAGTLEPMLERLWIERESRRRVIEVALKSLSGQVDVVFDRVAAKIEEEKP